MTVMVIRQLRRNTSTPPPLPAATSASPVPFRPRKLRPSPYPVFKARAATLHSPITAMQYYRIWIYTCNAALFVCVLGFVLVASTVVVADNRRHFVPEFSLAHPSLFYMYFALVAQSGFLQLVGCIGARTLNEKLLNAYLLALFALVIGDVVLGVYWVYHSEFIANEIKPGLKTRFHASYGKDKAFTGLWDDLQRNDHCCGVENYNDFYRNESAVNFGIFRDERNESAFGMTLLPESCCNHEKGRAFLQTTMKPAAAEARRSNIGVSFTSTTTTTIPPLPNYFATEEPIAVTDVVLVDGVYVRCPMETDLFYTTGCEKRLLAWLKSRLDILFVLGYCVIWFIKVCFLGILRYEVREMIQKINIIRNEMRSAEMCGSSVGLHKIQPLQRPVRRYNYNGSVVVGGAPMNRSSKDEVLEEEEARSTAEENATSPLLKVKSTEAEDSVENTPMTQHRLNTLVDAGNDSDTNSHSALLESKFSRCKSIEMREMPTMATATLMAGISVPSVGHPPGVGAHRSRM